MLSDCRAPPISGKVKTFISINQENLGFFLYLPITFQETGKFVVS